MTENLAQPASAEQAAKPRMYKRRARNILIHRPMQKEFTMVLIALLMVSLLAISFVIHATIREAVFGGGYRFGTVSPAEVLSSDVSYLLIVRVACVIFVTLIIIGMFGVFFLHRVAGPVYRFSQTFLKLREGDFFEETAQEINKYLERLKAQHPAG